MSKSDSSTEDVPLANFAAKGVTTLPENGAVLATTDTKVAITHTASSQSVDQAITVNPAEGPTVTTANITVDGTKIQVTFDRGMASPLGKHEQFSVTYGSENTPNIVTGAQLVTNETIIQLDLTDAIPRGVEIKLSYTAGDVQDADGKLLASFVDYPVTNIPLSNETRILTKDGGTGGILKIAENTKEVILKNAGQKVQDLLSSVQCFAMNSIQTYVVTDSTGVTTRGNDDLVADGDKLIVTAENGEDTATYTIVQDTTSLTLNTGLEYLNAAWVKLTFNKALDKTTAEDANNYAVTIGSGTATVAKAVRGGQDANVVVLLVAPGAGCPSGLCGLKDGENVEVTVSGVTDWYGNTISGTDSATYTKATAAPKVMGVEYFNDTTLNVYFSEALDKTSAETAANYTLSGTGGLTGNPSVAMLGGDDYNVVTFTVGDMSSMTDGQTVTVTVAGVKDAGGTAVGSEDNSAIYTKATAPVITFVPANGTTGVKVNPNISITFDQDVTLLDGSAIDASAVWLHNDTDTSFVVFEATWDSNEKKITVNAYEDYGPEKEPLITVNRALKNSCDYTLRIKAVKDDSGNVITQYVEFKTMS